ncbi:hypothetical protein J6590_014047 [Homalodisca vitripennis]|nr:hypothetical protein J6590_014047 [Homalodisca vitripennis]
MEVNSFHQQSFNDLTYTSETKRGTELKSEHRHPLPLQTAKQQVPDPRPKTSSTFYNTDIIMKRVTEATCLNSERLTEEVRSMNSISIVLVNVEFSSSSPSS